MHALSIIVTNPLSWVEGRGIDQNPAKPLTFCFPSPLLDFIQTLSIHTHFQPQSLIHSRHLSI